MHSSIIAGALATPKAPQHRRLHRSKRRLAGRGQLQRLRRGREQHRCAGAVHSEAKASLPSCTARACCVCVRTPYAPRKRGGGARRGRGSVGGSASGWRPGLGQGGAGGLVRLPALVRRVLHERVQRGGGVNVGLQHRTGTHAHASAPGAIACKPAHQTRARAPQRPSKREGVDQANP
jgi:hypothetical protein